MVTIKLAKPIKLQATSISKLSGFVSFDYDPTLVNLIKQLGKRVYIPDEKSWEIPESSIPTLVKKLKDYDVTVTGEFTKEKSIDVNIPKGFSFKTNPYKHQIEGVLYGIEHESFLLGDDQGLGKTKQIIDIALCKKSEGMKHCLIICGINGTKYNWADEIKIHSNEEAWVLGTRYTRKKPIKMVEGGTKEKLEDLQNIPSQFFWITNIETLRGGAYKEGKAKNSKYRFPIAERIQELVDDGTIGMIAFDEAHKAKNPDSQQGRALLSIKSNNAIPMSGTFVLNNPLDLYLPLRWAGFEDHSFYQYKNHYCVMGGFNGKDVVGYKNLDELRELMERVMLRRTKEDVLDLPPKVHSIEYVELTEDQKKLYKEVKTKIVDSIDKIRMYPDPLSEMLRLRQVTGAPEILSTTMTKSAKLDRLKEMVEELVSVNEKAIIFSQWSTMTDIIRERLKEYNPAYITGDVKSEDRMSEVKKFQTDDSCKVIIGTIGAMGTGLTLTAASTVIFVDEPWNRGLKDQAEDRAHRIGTKGTVRVVTLIAKDTIDEGVYNLVQKKGRMADFLIDGKVENRNIDETLNYLLSFGG